MKLLRAKSDGFKAKEFTNILKKALELSIPYGLDEQTEHLGSSLADDHQMISQFDPKTNLFEHYHHSSFHCLSGLAVLIPF